MRGDHGGERGEHHERQQKLRRHQPIERILQRRDIPQQQRTLTEIIEQERRIDREIPRPRDRAATEMTEVGIERLAAGHAQQHRAEDREGDPGMPTEQHQCMRRVDGGEHAGMLQDRQQAEHGQRREPHHHHRPEQSADGTRAVTLQQEQTEQDRDRQRQHDRLERRRDELQALDRAEHRDRRRDHPVAEEERTPGQAERHHRWRPTPRHRARDELHEREHATFAFVVGAQHDGDILDADHERDGPEDQRQDAEDVLEGTGVQARHGEHRSEGVQRTRADIAEHHTHRRHSQRERDGPTVERGHAGIILLGTDPLVYGIVIFPTTSSSASPVMTTQVPSVPK